MRSAKAPVKQVQSGRTCNRARAEEKRVVPSGSWEETMRIQKGFFALAGVVAMAIAASGASAQKYGGVLKIQHMDTPPSASILEEATVSVVVPFMALFNNLVSFDQHVARTRLHSSVPGLSMRWGWITGRRPLTFRARLGRTRHSRNARPLQ